MLRHLRDVTRRDPSVSLLRRRYARPIGISPTDLAGLFRPDADVMFAADAREANVPSLLSSASNGAWEDVIKVAPEHVSFKM
jgi:L-lactate dehydrogenase (cytochrome)/(S)-mandelate dehydrogenase